MAIGNSIFVSSQDDPGGRRLRLAAYSYAYMHKEFRYQFAESFKKGVPGHRIWRVSNGPTEKGNLPNRPLVRDVAGRSPVAADVDDTGQAEYEKQREEEESEYERQKATALAEMKAEKLTWTPSQPTQVSPNSLGNTAVLAMDKEVAK